MNALVRIAMFTPWVLAIVGSIVLGYWMLEPVPMRVVYVAPHFISEPVKTRQEATQHYVTEVRGGTTVWRYIEYCVSRQFNAHVHRSWVNEAMVWHAPALPTYLSRTVGCREVVLPVVVPTSNPTRTFDYLQTMEIEMNPIRVERVEYDPIRLTILANGK